MPDEAVEPEVPSEATITITISNNGIGVDTDFDPLSLIAYLELTKVTVANDLIKPSA